MKMVRTIVIRMAYCGRRGRGRQHTAPPGGSHTRLGPGVCRAERSDGQGRVTRQLLHSPAAGTSGDSPDLSNPGSLSVQ